VIEVIRRITKEKPNGHSYTKAVIPQEDSFVTGVINGCNTVTSACSCRMRETFHANNTLNE
jgi:hypothetical protein